MQLKERLPIQKYSNFLPSMVSLSKSSMPLLGDVTPFSTELAAMRFFLEFFRLLWLLSRSVISRLFSSVKALFNKSQKKKQKNKRKHSIYICLKVLEKCIILPTYILSKRLQWLFKIDIFHFTFLKKTLVETNYLRATHSKMKLTVPTLMRLAYLIILLTSFTSHLFHFKGKYPWQ